jgi:hypothetical protein
MDTEPFSFWIAILNPPEKTCPDFAGRAIRLLFYFITWKNEMQAKFSTR